MISDALFGMGLIGRRRDEVPTWWPLLAQDSSGTARISLIEIRLNYYFL